MAQDTRAAESQQSERQAGQNEVVLISCLIAATKGCTSTYGTIARNATSSRQHKPSSWKQASYQTKRCQSTLPKGCSTSESQRTRPHGPLTLSWADSLMVMSYVRPASRPRLERRKMVDSLLGHLYGPI